jgi:hypothetical protein
MSVAEKHVACRVQRAFRASSDAIFALGSSGEHFLRARFRAAGFPALAAVAKACGARLALVSGMSNAFKAFAYCAARIVRCSAVACLASTFWACSDDEPDPSLCEAVERRAAAAKCSSRASLNIDECTNELGSACGVEYREYLECAEKAVFRCDGEGDTQIEGCTAQGAAFIDCERGGASDGGPNCRPAEGGTTCAERDAGAE